MVDLSTPFATAPRQISVGDRQRRKIARTVPVWCGNKDCGGHVCQLCQRRNEGIIALREKPADQH